MSRARYAPEFKAEAVKQVTERGHGVVEVAKRLGISDKSLYLWVRQAKDQDSGPAATEAASLRSEMAKLKAELKRTTEERDILKKAAAYFARESG
ncbi:transposase [Paucibacter sp. B2R-40]|jgi:transposase|uniref:transposase n=1 Tax=Paucibacter sp. B2R-40 TaxID=2893554 RepID=UPI0021E460D9|nr:transposase [Paucibacter sp. B2R-40]MCV2356004.1 transposase [Paucibacter sp. B2R-40]